MFGNLDFVQSERLINLVKIHKQTNDSIQQQQWQDFIFFNFPSPLPPPYPKKDIYPNSYVYSYAFQSLSLPINVSKY